MILVKFFITYFMLSFFLHAEVNYFSLKSEFVNLNGKGLLISQKKSFLSGKCYEKEEPKFDLIGGLYLEEKKPMKGAVVILQAPSDAYPIDYPAQIKTEKDEKLMWLIVNSRWGMYHYSLANFGKDLTVFNKSGGAYKYSIKQVPEGYYLVHFESTSEMDEEEDSNIVPIDAYCILSKNF